MGGMASQKLSKAPQSRKQKRDNKFELYNSRHFNIRRAEMLKKRISRSSPKDKKSGKVVCKSLTK